MSSLAQRGRSPDTALRDRLRELERATTYTPPPEPEVLPEGETSIDDADDPALDIPPPYTQDDEEEGFVALAAAEQPPADGDTGDTGDTEPATVGPVVQVGSWQLSEDPTSGDLIATHADGATRVVATKGTT